MERGIPKKNLIYFVIFFLIVGIITTNIVLNLFWLNPYLNDLKNKLVNYQISETKRVAGIVDRFIEKELSDIEKLATDIALSKKNEEMVNFFIERFLKENTAIKEISIINLEGKEENRYSKSYFFSKEDLRDLSFLEEFEIPKKEKIYLSPISFTDYAEPYIIIAVPIKKHEIEEPQGILRVVFYVGQSWEDVLEMTIGETGHIMIIDDRGMLVADPNPVKVLQRINLLDLPPAKLILMGKMLSGEEYINKEGQRVIGTGVPLKSLKGGVIIEQSKSETERPIQEIQKIIITFLIFGLVIAGILTWLIFIFKKADRELIQRYLMIEKSKEELEELKAVLEIKVSARTKALKELTESLEQKVKEKTKELQERIGELEKFHKMAVGRELKMIELKEEIKRLKEELEKLKKKP